MWERFTTDIALNKERAFLFMNHQRCFVLKDLTADDALKRVTVLSMRMLVALNLRLEFFLAEATSCLCLVKRLQVLRHILSLADLVATITFYLLPHPQLVLLLLEPLVFQPLFLNILFFPLRLLCG